MASRIEYAETLVFTREEANKMRLGQWDIKYHGYKNKQQSVLQDALTIIATILSMAFKLPTPVTLAAGVIATAVSSTQSLLDQYIKMAEDGQDYLQMIVTDIFDANPGLYEAVEVELPFLEFLEEDEGYRIVSGNGAIKRLKTENGWIYA